MNKQYEKPQETLTQILWLKIREHIRTHGQPPTRGFCNHNDYVVLARENEYPNVDLTFYDCDFRFYGIEFYIVHNPCAKLSLVV